MNAFAVLLADNNRAKAYVQNLASRGLIPCAALVLNDPATVMAENRDVVPFHAARVHSSRDTGTAFDETEGVLVTLEKHNVPCTLLNTLDVNAGEVVRAVAALPARHVIFAGPGGTLLGKELLSVGKEFLHAHPGKLPDYRGSTTIYYSMLARGCAWCSILLMREEIDAGPVLHVKRFEYTDATVDMDQAYDPLVRAATMAEFLETADLEAIPDQPQGRGAGHTYFIIHPVLKHLAILKARAGEESP